MTDDLTPEEKQRVFDSLENYRSEKGEAAFRELIDFAKWAVEMAETDGVPLSLLLEAMRHKS
jgi:hypothetical protein